MVGDQAMAAASHPLYKAVEASTMASASYGYGSFVETIAVFLKKAIDTPEERAQITAAALLAYDSFIAARLGPVVAPVLREVVGTVINNLLKNLGT